MRVAVAGATGNIGARTVTHLEKGGHEAVGISRSLGVDLVTGDGLEAALRGVDAIIDTISSPAVGREETVDYFGTTTRNLLDARGERRRRPPCPAVNRRHRPRRGQRALRR